MNLEGAVVLVTGANGGLGQVFVKQLLDAKVGKIYAAGRKLASLEKVVAMDSSRVVPVQIDVTKEDEVNAAAQQCSDLTVLVNNAGVSRDTSALQAPSLENARQEMETNYFGCLAMCRAFAPVLKTNGGGAIVNLVSFLGKVNLPFMGTYCASKAAELSLTQCVRAEVAAQGTLVVAVMPATIDTKFAEFYPPPKVAPEEVVRATLEALASDTEDIYPGEQAAQLSEQILQDPKGIEKYLAGMLPEMFEQLKQQAMANK